MLIVYFGPAQILFLIEMDDLAAGRLESEGNMHHSMERFAHARLGFWRNKEQQEATAAGAGQLAAQCPALRAAS